MTNIVTSSPAWPFILGLIGAVVVWIAALTVWQAGRDEHTEHATLRASLAQVLKPLTVAVRTPGQHTASNLLAAEHAVTPFRTRGDEQRELLIWCKDHSGSVLREMARSSGIRTSRLAVEVGRQRPPPWTAGRCVSGHASELIPAMVACGEWTLAIVNDAENQPNVAQLVQQRQGLAHQLRMIETSRESIIVADVSKFGIRNSFKIAACSELVTLLTNRSTDRSSELDRIVATRPTARIQFAELFATT